MIKSKIKCTECGSKRLIWDKLTGLGYLCHECGVLNLVNFFKNVKRKII